MRKGPREAGAWWEGSCSVPSRGKSGGSEERMCPGVWGTRDGQYGWSREQGERGETEAGGFQPADPRTGFGFDSE